jgi:hypothetical protein
MQLMCGDFEEQKLFDVSSEILRISNS